jgi:hypothetical protein
MDNKINITLTADEIKILISVLTNAEIEAEAASQKRHVTFLPNLFDMIISNKNELAKIKKYFINEFNKL